MTLTIDFRNIEVDTTLPVDDWPFEAILTIIERGRIDDWRILARAIWEHPWGATTRAVQTIIDWNENYGADALFRTTIERARHAFRDRHRARDGQRLRDLRCRAGLSLRELSERAGITAALLSNYETGSVSPTLDAVARICHATDQSPLANNSQIDSDNNDRCALVTQLIDRLPPPRDTGLLDELAADDAASMDDLSRSSTPRS